MMSKFKDRFQLTPEQSLFLAKKKWDENVYCGMKMENRAVTFPQTLTILNGVNVPNVQLDDIQAILNMRDAWKFLLNTVKEPVTFEYWCKLNEYIARNEALEWGKLRTGSVGISGTDYEPPVPNKEKTAEELKNILSAPDVSSTDKALEAFTWGARGQFFWDGNKRTSLMLANKILVSSGTGIMTITDKYMEQFNTLLLNYYNTGKSEELKQFLYENAIQGMKI
jgi:Fic family protein